MLVMVTAPSAEPVTLAEIKTRLGVDYDDHDAFLTAAIKAARMWVEKRCGRALISQTWEYRTEEFEDRMELPLRPVIELTSVKYVDEDGDEQTLDAEDYIFIDAGPDNAAILMPTDEWPEDAYERPDAIRIRFVAGYPPSDESPADYAANVPEDLKEAIRQYVGQVYELRESAVLAPTRQEIVEVPNSLSALLASYIVPRL